MSTQDERDESRLAIDIEPEFRKRIETAAAERGMSMRDYVVAALREALDSNGSERPSSQSAEWSQLSTRSFARDWESDVDAIYDDLA
jgi:hypothetical protein